jgi:hypothetical protein
LSPTRMTRGVLERRRWIECTNGCGFRKQFFIFVNADNSVSTALGYENMLGAKFSDVVAARAQRQKIPQSICMCLQPHTQSHEVSAVEEILRFASPLLNLLPTYHAFEPTVEQHTIIRHPSELHGKTYSSHHLPKIKDHHAGGQQSLAAITIHQFSLETLLN